MLFRLPDPVRPSCPIVKSQDCLSPSCDSSKRHGDHQHKALDNGITGKEHIPLTASIMADHHIHNNDQGAVRGNDQKGGKPHSQYLNHNMAAVASKGNGYKRPFSQKKAQHNCTGYHL